MSRRKPQDFSRYYISTGDLKSLKASMGMFLQQDKHLRPPLTKDVKEMVGGLYREWRTLAEQRDARDASAAEFDEGLESILERAGRFDVKPEWVLSTAAYPYIEEEQAHG